ncbi:30S ribosomal protein S21 [Flavisericum labens]|uniref:30S ribosomal protein S21 n=1 Tax=Flavisericum labens TaxID=3377112 RepID=UPI00387B7A69
MLKIIVKDGENIERALKRYKRKHRNIKVMQNLRENQFFTKPSVKRRREIQKAAYIQNLRDQEDI